MENLETTQINSVKDGEKRQSPAGKAGYQIGLKIPLMNEKIDAMSDEEVASRIDEILKTESPAFLRGMLFELEKETESEGQPTIDEQTQERIKAYYKKLDPQAKLAICTFSELECLEGINFQHLQKEGKLIDEIRSDLQNSCIEKYNPDSDDDYVVAEDIWLAGVWETVRMILQNC